MINEKIKIKYNELFDIMNEQIRIVNSIDNTLDPDYEPYFKIIPESERKENPTLDDLNDIKEQIELLKH